LDKKGWIIHSEDGQILQVILRVADPWSSGFIICVNVNTDHYSINIGRHPKHRPLDYLAHHSSEGKNIQPWVRKMSKHSFYKLHLLSF
jgi:hypothetical protein